MGKVVDDEFGARVRVFVFLAGLTGPIHSFPSLDGCYISQYDVGAFGDTIMIMMPPMCGIVRFA